MKTDPIEALRCGGWLGSSSVLHRLSCGADLILPSAERGALSPEIQTASSASECTPSLLQSWLVICRSGKKCSECRTGLKPMGQPVATGECRSGVEPIFLPSDLQTDGGDRHRNESDIHDLNRETFDMLVEVHARCDANLHAVFLGRPPVVEDAKASAKKRDPEGNQVFRLLKNLLGRIGHFLLPNDHWSATPSWRLEIRNGPRRGVAL